VHVIFLAPHFPANQRRFVRGLKSVGARITGIGDAPARVLDGEIRGLLDDYEEVGNVTDLGQVVRAVRAIQARGPWVHKLEAVVEAHTMVAALAREATGIPGTSSFAVERCRDKAVMKAFLADHGIPVARNRPVDSPEEARSFAREIGYPLIVKPRDGAGASGTSKVLDADHLEHVMAGLRFGPGRILMEEFLSGHELFYDTLTIEGEVVYEFASHYYPGVLEAMRTRDVSPRIVTTNRLGSGGYQDLRELGWKVIRALGLRTTATHMEAFVTPRGLVFSEIGARPPGVGMWDCYSAALGFDLYTEWARGVCWGDVQSHTNPRKAAGLVAIRPNQDGTIVGYTGADVLQQKYGDAIFKAYLPPPGTPTQPVDAGYMANAWAMVAHPDYDTCNSILEDIGHTLKVWAR